ncbi:helix-turn-helix domain-containing protein [Flagellimonas allohymeniacidonis]|uniref:AraC family transcriptional regulator n=1 Tax=Flagellimonas allohymeniacidonis TaxID=2517819 RepID=A0A4V2HSX6_9FLAO|nr:AraC family transcriptional regulator [Allomuricauda hymeniacidonis]TAI49430.1 AraC family transcriptional regulator [Allomuricauda hymeniacidonis]
MSVKSYNQLSELFRNEEVGKTLDQDSEFTIHRLELVHPKPTKSPTFRANYYSFVLVKKGSTKYSIDNHVFSTRDRTLYFTNPGHLKSFDISEVTHGFLITVSEAYLKENIHEKVFDDFSFLLTEIVPPCHLEETRFSELHNLAEQILSEQKNGSILKHKIISSLFMVFLLKVKEYLLGDADFKQAYDRDSEIVNQFKKDLESKFRNLVADKSVSKTIPQVQDFAEAQHLNPSYFSTVIKTKTSRTANQWIQGKICSEAKALLSNTRDSIKEIAYTLGFHEATHFSKFFKKYEGVTPGAFRKAKRD